jgi:chromosome segregation ATPase
VLSDPSSLGYLERELKQRTSELAQSERKRFELEANVAILSDALLEKDQAVKKSNFPLDATKERLNAFETQAKQSKAESAQFKKQLEELIPELKNYRDKDNGWMVDTRWLW